MTGLQYGNIVYDGRGIDYSAVSLNVTADGIENFALYANDFFEGVALTQARERLEGSGLTDDETELMARTYAEINSSYFAGRPFKESEYTAGIELWRTKENGFISKYIDSMLTKQEGNQTVKIKFK